MTILKTKKLTKQFGGVQAVDKFSFSLTSGEILGVVGPNGSGKSTLVNVLTGVIPFDKGIIVIGKEILSRIQARDLPVYGITRTFQDARVFEQMTVLDNILVVLTERSVARSLFEHHSAYHKGEAERVLREVDLWEKRDALATNLSYGQRKLLEIARARAMRANIFLFDEPFAGMFPEMINRVMRIMRTLKEEEKTIILIEHNMDIIRKLCDRVLVMNAGSFLAEGKPDVVLARKDVVEAYLGE